MGEGAVITVVTGPPGSGKTYYTCRVIEQAAREGKFVATNVRLREGWALEMAKGNPFRRTRTGRARYAAQLLQRVVYVQSMGELAQLRLATKGWEKKLEGRGVAVFDEAGEELDSRESMTGTKETKARRKADNTFLKQHRKLGWDVYLIAQQAEQLDTRARGIAEYEITLRNLRRYKVMTFLAGGFPIWPFGNLFIAIWRWAAIPGRSSMKREWFTLSKRIAGLYDTHQIVYEVDDGDHALLPGQAPSGWMLTVPDLLAAAQGGRAAGPQGEAADPAAQDAHGADDQGAAVGRLTTRQAAQQRWGKTGAGSAEKRQGRVDADVEAVGRSSTESLD